MPSRKIDLIKSLLSSIKVNPITGCWEWQKSFGDRGRYGRFYFHGRAMSSHKFAYITYIGEIELPLEVCHKCDNTKCCNPFHLFKGTHTENLHDAQRKGRLPISKCPSLQRYALGCRCDECVELYRRKSREANVRYRKNNPERTKEHWTKQNRRTTEKRRALKLAQKNIP